MPFPLPRIPAPLEEPLGQREEEEENPNGNAGSPGWLVVLWSARQSRWLSIRWVGEWCHLIRGVNGPAISLRLQGPDIRGSFFFSPSISFFTNNCMVFSWWFMRGSLGLTAE